MRHRAHFVVAGPLPPPVGGATRTFEAFVEALDESSADAIVVDTSPRQGRRGRGKLRTLLALVRAILLARVKHRALVLFGSSSTIIRASAVLRLAPRSRTVVVVFGSNLATAVDRSRRSARLWRTLGEMREVFVETSLCAREVEATAGLTVSVLGPYRPAISWFPPPTGKASRELRAAFVGRVRRDKGVLEAIQAVQACGEWHLMIAGEVDPGFRSEFERACRGSDRVEYVGVLAAEEVSHLLASVDVSILLSTYPGEGAAGSVVESLMVGTPAVVSDHRALPELVEHGATGFIVPRDRLVADTMKALAEVERLSPVDRRQMRERCMISAQRFSPVSAVRTVLEAFN